MFMEEYSEKKKTDSHPLLMHFYEVRSAIMINGTTVVNN